MRVGPARLAIDSEDNQGDDVARDLDAGGNNAPNPPVPAAPPTKPPAGGSANALEEGANPTRGDDNMNDNDSNEPSNRSDAPDDSKPEDLNR